MLKQSVETIELLSYRRSNLNPSDHKPVSALFQCNLRSIIITKINQVYNELVKKLDYWNNPNNNVAPSIRINQLLINMDHLKYEQPLESIIQITNTSQTIVHWRFLTKLAETDISKRWIHVNSKRGLLLPDEVSCHRIIY